MSGHGYISDADCTPLRAALGILAVLALALACAWMVARMYDDPRVDWGDAPAEGGVK